MQGVVLVCGQQAPPLAPLKPYLRNFQYAVHVSAASRAKDGVQPAPLPAHLPILP